MYRLATVLSLQCAPLPSLYSAPVHWGPSATLWGLGPPNPKFTFLDRNIFKDPAELRFFANRQRSTWSYDPEIFKGVTGQNLEKSGFEFLGVFNKGTCGATCRKIVVPSFSVGQTMINAVGMVSISTSGPEL